MIVKSAAFFAANSAFCLLTLSLPIMITSLFSGWRFPIKIFCILDSPSSSLKLVLGTSKFPSLNINVVAPVAPDLIAISLCSIPECIELAIFFIRTA